MIPLRALMIPMTGTASEGSNSQSVKPLALSGGIQAHSSTTLYKRVRHSPSRGRYSDAARLPTLPSHRLNYVPSRRWLRLLALVLCRTRFQQLAPPAARHHMPGRWHRCFQLRTLSPSMMTRRESDSPKMYNTDKALRRATASLTRHQNNCGSPLNLPTRTSG